jgi:hypothetical protein
MAVAWHHPTRSSVDGRKYRHFPGFSGIIAGQAPGAADTGFAHLPGDFGVAPTTCSDVATAAITP